jgi:hypothetical protein
VQSQALRACRHPDACGHGERNRLHLRRVSCRPRRDLIPHALGEHCSTTTLSNSFRDHPLGLALYRAVADIIASIGPAETTVSKSQISFRVSQEVSLCLAT